jgi:hypothetical protein
MKLLANRNQFDGLASIAFALAQAARNKALLRHSATGAFAAL